LESQAASARKRLEALKAPIPTATPEAIAEDKREIASRGSLGTVGKVMENFHRGPDVSEATKVGEPTLVDPKQSSAPDLIRAATASVNGGLSGGNSVTVEKVGDGTTPPENAPLPRSDAATDASQPAGSNTTQPTATDAGSADTSGGAPAAGSEMKNDLPPAPGTAAPAPPTQVNDIPGSTSSSSTQPAASASTPQQAPPANSDTESSSKKKKKKHLLLF
jgi:outer membrane protein assembly factor BamD